MSSMRNQFEKELKNKLALKSSGYTTEETVLLKAFKYFDLDNSGCCSKNEFIKAINKIGITGLTEENLEELFSVYDVDGSGELDYKEFVGIIFNRSNLAPKKQPSQQQQPSSVKKQDQCKSKGEFIEQDQIQEILLKIRERLASRGVRGICSIAKNFAIIDDDNSHVIDFDEFRKCCKDFRFGLSDDEVELAFSAFDRDNSGNVEYDEFLRAIRGNTCNDFRRGLIEQAFNILDRDKSGVVEMEEIKEIYNAKNHPDVRNGKRTEDEVIMEFIETFEATYNYLNGEQADGKVTIEEFMEYYENVSMSIDDDEYFRLMISNAWGLSGNTTYNNKKKGWSNKDEEPQETVSQGYNKKFGTKKTQQAPTGKNLRSKGRQPAAAEEQQEESERTDPSIERPIQKLRNALKKRGGKGIIGLARQFKIFDDNNSKTLDMDEFTKAMGDFQVGLSDPEIRQLFKKIDRDNSGVIDYDEFLRKVRGKMNETRKRIVQQAFDKLDSDGSGIIEINDIKTIYNAKNNKDVLAGKKTEEEVYGEFIETFETHHNIRKGQRDRRVTKEEFLEYYNNISMSIDDDEYFIEMVKNAWKLGEQPKYSGQQAWSAEVGSEPPRKKGRTLGEKNRKAGTYDNAPFGTDDEPVNYSTSNNPNGRLRAQPSSNAKQMKFSNKGDDVLVYFRERMAARGTRGIMSMRRAFMIADDDNSKTIDINEFQKFCHDYRIELNEDEVQKLFDIFDRDHSGAIDYDEFVRELIGEMPKKRQEIVKKAFNKLDKNGNGQLEVDDIKGTYNASRHPDVLCGKKTEDEVLAEFLDNFEYHFSLLNMERTRDSKITLEEFIEYYNNISMSIDDDAYFEAMMTAAYNLDNKPNYGKGWKGEY